MKTKFLGTSHGAPLPGRHCQSILIETNAGAYLFDAGAPAEKLKDCKTDAVAVIHVFPLRRFSELHEIEPTVPARMIYPADGDELTL